MSTWQLLLNAPTLAAGFFVKYLFFKKRGFGKVYREAFLEGLKTAKNCRKVPELPGKFRQEVKIQAELIWGTILYVYEFSKRQMAKMEKNKQKDVVS